MEVINLLDRCYLLLYFLHHLGVDVGRQEGLIPHGHAKDLEAPPSAGEGVGEFVVEFWKRAQRLPPCLLFPCLRED